MSLFKKILLVFLGICLFIIVIIISVPYVLSPIYDFPQTKPFSGDSIYNPYKNIKSENWLKGNFHCHSNFWGHLTNGRGTENSMKNIVLRYKSLGYDIICVSDYQHISTTNDPPHLYVNAYEHALGPFHYHHLVLGAKYVSWLDFIGFEGLSQKQFMMNHLYESALLPVIAHPKFTGSYKPNDFKYLCNYNVLEVLNQNRFSIDCWDTALSTGHTVFLLADDDGHNIDSTLLVQRCFTMVNTKSRTENGIINALKAGSSYGVDFYMREKESFEDKAKDEREFKTIKSVTVHNNVLSVTFPEKVKEIRFIGQNGLVKEIIKNIDSASYTFKTADTYIRTEITVKDLSKIYLNPVIKYNGKSLPYYKAKINGVETLFYRAILMIVLVIIFYFIGSGIIKVIKKQPRLSYNS